MAVQVCSKFYLISTGSALLAVNKQGFRKLEIPSFVQEGETFSLKETCDKSERIVCTCISSDETLIAVGTESKLLIVWETSEWKIIKVEMLIKRPMAVTFAHSTSALIIADKTGDVYKFEIDKESCIKESQESFFKKTLCIRKEENSAPLLGHLSMLLDVQVTPDDRFLVTCDRDEKIRVSSYPNAYNIHTFCLGHEEFVSKIAVLAGSGNLLLSCSGDGFLMLWDYLQGKCLALTQPGKQCLSLLTTTPYKVQTDENGSTEETSEDLSKGNKEPVEKEERSAKDRGVVALTGFSYCATGDGKHYIAVTLDRTHGIMVYLLANQNFEVLGTIVTEGTPLATGWLSNKQLVLLVEVDTEPAQVYNFDGCQFHRTMEHQIVELSRDQPHIFKSLACSTNLDIMYKQRYDNVKEYFSKKEKRISESNPAAKKARWGK